MNKKHGRIIGFAFLVLAAIFALGCSSATGSDTQETPMTQGNYKEEANGFHPWSKYDVTVIVGERSIVDIVVDGVDDTNNSAEFGQKAIPILRERVLQYQTSGVDTVAGCTITSRGFLNAVEKALVAANAPERMLNAPSMGTTEETVDAGVLVMGSGIAGLTAAIKAKTDKPDARVILIEKMELTGGSTRMSGSWFYIPADDGETAKAEAAEYLRMRGRNQVDMTLINQWANNSRAVYTFLSGAIPAPYVALGTSPVPRALMYNAATQGSGLVEMLLARAQALGVTILTGVKGAELITRDTTNGVEVIGAKAVSNKGINYTFNVSGGVILATGGFGWNRALLQEFTPQTANDDSNSHPGNTGDGIIMGRDIGAALVFNGAKVGYGTKARGTFEGIKEPWGSRVIASDGEYIPYTGANDVRPAEPAGTNIDGRQHGALTAVTYEQNANTDNNTNYRWMVEKRARTPGVRFWNPSVTTPSQTLIDGGWAFTSDTIAGLADKIGMDANALESAFVGVGVSTAGRVTVASVYPSDLGTFGGLKINANGQVLGDGTKGATADQPISGLYAAGETASGQFFYVEYPASGLSLSTSSTMGYFAGAHAAARIPAVH